MITMTLNKALDYVDDIGLSDYPIEVEGHRETLNNKILNHYDAQQIGFETIEKFSFALKRRMHEIMPYYNQMYRSELLVIDPLNTLKMHSEDSSSSTSTETTDGTSITDATNNTTGKNVSYTMPQTALGGDEDYADSANDSVGAGTSSANATNTGQSDGTTTATSTSDVEGFQGSQSDLLQRYRDTFLNIDMEIIDRLSDLFLGIWEIPNTQYESDRRPYGRIF